MASPGNQINKLRNDQGWSLARLAKEVKNTTGHQTYPQQLSRLEIGETKLTADWIERLANTFNVSLNEILGEAGAATTGEEYLYGIVGTVQAGVWTEAFEIAEEDRERVAFPVGNYPGKEKLFALRVKGDSMDKLGITNGSTLLVYPVELYPGAVTTGSIVVAQQQNAAGDFHTTVKQLEITDDGHYLLWPRSTDPDHQAPLRLPHPDSFDPESADAASELLVIGLVVGVVSLNLPLPA